MALVAGRRVLKDLRKLKVRLSRNNALSLLAWLGKEGVFLWSRQSIS